MNPHFRMERLRFLARVVEREIAHLRVTDARVFTRSFDEARVESLESDVALSEQVDAFVSRFGRLQDTVGDKLLPTYLLGLGESVGAVLDNLTRAEQLGLLGSSDLWMTLRALRNQMIHEYMEDRVILASALNAGHEHVETLCADAECLLSAIQSRGWLEGET